MKLLSLTVNGSDGQPINIQPPSDLQGISKLRLNDILQSVIPLILYVIILLSFFFVVFSGLKWMLSQGDKKAIDEARKTLTFAIGGLVLALLSFFIINIILYSFGLPALNR